MKTIARILVLILVIGLLAAIPAEAQEAAFAGFFVQEAPSGLIVNNGDGTYTLTLNEVGDTFELLANVPTPLVGTVNAGDVILSWVSNPDGLAATAMLGIGDVFVSLTLTAPVYDAAAETITYTATLFDEDSKYVPDVGAFGPATLYILADTAFLQGLAVGEANSGARAELCRVFFTPFGPMEICTWGDTGSGFH